jgi:hypothetical protein
MVHVPLIIPQDNTDYKKKHEKSKSYIREEENWSGVSKKGFLAGIKN